jgi:hypothetical protein
MATREQIRYLQTARPFQPFRIKLAGGNTFTVTHPELASCSVNGRELVVHDEQGMHLLEMTQVERIEPVAFAAPPRAAGDGE